MPQKTSNSGIYKDPPIMTRQIDITRESIIDEQSRLVRLSFSSEEPYTRNSFFSEPWVEVLGHDDSEIDLKRLNSSAPLLYNHDRTQRDNRIGVVERAWVENGRGVAEVRLSKRAEVEGIWQDVRDGILRNVSVAYQIIERKVIEEHKDKPDVYRVIQWEPREISLVDIPADSTVGIGRSAEDAPGVGHLDSQPQPNQKEKTMPDKTVDTSQGPERDVKDDPATVTRSELEQAQLDAKEQGAKEALETEKARRESIRTLFKGHDSHSDVLQRCLDDPQMDENEARKLLLEAIGNEAEPTGGERIQMGETDIEKFSRAAEDAIAYRAGIADVNAKPTEVVGYTLFEMARKSLELRGINTSRMDKRELVGRAFTHSTSDFPKLLENNARKAMLRGYEEAQEVFQRFTRTGNLSDFKIHNRLGLGVFDSLDEVPESGEYKHGTIGERGEPIQLATYGKLFSISRQAIINDDLTAFTDIPRKMGRAASRTVGDLVFAVINDNPNMSDGTALFHSDHNNLAGSGAAPTAATVGAGRTAMRTQKDGKATLNISPSFLLVPAALEDTARVLMVSETDPSKTNSRVPNPVRGAAEVVVDARLDVASTTAWYMLADPNMFDTIEVGYLDGIAAPFLDQQEGWTIDGVEYKVRIDAAAAPLEYRTMYKNAGQ